MLGNSAKAGRTWAKLQDAFIISEKHRMKSPILWIHVSGCVCVLASLAPGGNGLEV
jgi:Ni,Fe-hydrogenase I small subunit